MSRNLRFEALVQAVLPDLYRYAFWLSRDPEQAEDLVQESLLRAWRALDSLQDESSARAWLLRIVRNEHARVYERKQAELVDISTLAGEDERKLAHSDRPEIDELRAAMLRLGEDYREPLVLQVLMGYSTSEIAELMGLSTGAVLTRLYRARKQLQREMSASSRNAPAEERQ